MQHTLSINDPCLHNGCTQAKQRKLLELHSHCMIVREGRRRDATLLHTYAGDEDTFAGTQQWLLISTTIERVLKTSRMAIRRICCCKHIANDNCNTPTHACVGVLGHSFSFIVGLTA
jgi:hypothetical protein